MILDLLRDYGPLGIFAAVLILEHIWLLRVAVPALLARHEAERERERKAFLDALLDLSVKFEAANSEVCRRLDRIHDAIEHLREAARLD